MLKHILLILLLSSTWMVYAETTDTTISYLIVVESTPPELFEKGQILAGEESIQLQSEQSVTLIASDGSVFTLIGTESGIPIHQVDNSEEPELALEKALSSLHGIPYSIVRRPDSQAPNVWMVNVEKGGKYCTLKSTINLWRDNTDKVEMLVITPHPRGKSQRIKWAAKKDVHAFAFQEGAAYRIKLANKSNQKFTFYQIPGKIKFIPHRVKWMADKGCVQQAKRCFPYNKSECQ